MNPYIIRVSRTPVNKCRNGKAAARRPVLLTSTRQRSLPCRVVLLSPTQQHMPTNGDDVVCRCTLHALTLGERAEAPINDGPVADAAKRWRGPYRRQPRCKHSEHSILLLNAWSEQDQNPSETSETKRALAGPARPLCQLATPTRAAIRCLFRVCNGSLHSIGHIRESCAARTSGLCSAS